MATWIRINFVLISCLVIYWAGQLPAAETIRYVGYPDCIELRNETTRVVLCPEAGGRVLVYALAGENALYLEEEETGKDYVPGEGASMSAGRFDIGPADIEARCPGAWSLPVSSSSRYKAFSPASA